MNNLYEKYLCSECGGLGAVQGVDGVFRPCESCNK